MFSYDRKRYFWVSLTAILQGFLLAQYMSASSGPFLALPLPLIVAVPFALWLAQEHWGRRLWRFILILTAILGLFHVYWLWSVLPRDHAIQYLPTQNLNLIRICTAVFLLLPFFQCRIATWSWRVPYSEVFFQFCRNIFLIFQAIIVTFIFWALLLTASLLFEIIGINFIPQIVSSNLTFALITSLTVALSISLALKHPGIDSLGRWILSILAWLLPPFSILSFIFVVSLPFSGLRTLWNTGQASTLMLLLQFATLLLANAAWLDGTRSPFTNKYVNGIAKLSLLCLPIYTALCLYSLGLRVQQYGWSVDRIHAAFLVAMAGLWGLGYAGLVLLRQWPAGIGRINSIAALILALTVVSMNSPILDPYRLSANSQVDRLIAGETDPEVFDFLYLRFNLGLYGNNALDHLMKNVLDSKTSSNGQSIPKLETIAERLLAALETDPDEYWDYSRKGIFSEKKIKEILEKAAVYPKDRQLDPAFITKLTHLPLSDMIRSEEIAFSFKNILETSNDEELLMILPGTIYVIDVSSDNPLVLGTAYGAFSPSALASGDINLLTPLPPRFKDIGIGTERYTISVF